MEETIKTDVLIIGAGLTGLTTAFYLKELDVKVLIVESRNRLGGRIKSDGYEENRPIELGATWLGSKHVKLHQLLQEIGLEVFPQAIGEKAIYEAISTSPPYLASLPPNPDPTLRIKGGSMKLINILSQKIGLENIQLNTKIEKVKYVQDHVQTFAEAKKIIAKKVITTIPPNLLVNTISFEPSLPSQLIALAKSTHTWMSQSIKVALRYEKAFWRSEKLSGTIFSNVGPIPEMYEHSNYEDTDHVLMGFFNGNYYSLTREERLKMALNQLKKYFGTQAEEYLSYHEEVWSNNKHTHYPYENHVTPHQNNGHPLYKTLFFDKHLIVAGTETSAHYPGYMEGAIHSAINAAHFIREGMNKTV